MEYKDQNISFEDFDLMRKMFDQDIKKMQFKILKNLNDLYEIKPHFIKAGEKLEESIKPNRKYKIKTVKNAISSALVSIGSFYVIENNMDVNISDGQQMLAICLPAMAGTLLLEVEVLKERRKELEKNFETLSDASKIYLLAFEILEEFNFSMDEYMSFRNYKGDSYSLKDEIKPIFVLNKDYIDKEIENSHFSPSFNYEEACSTLDYFCKTNNDGSIMMDFSHGKAKKRKR